MEQDGKHIAFIEGLMSDQGGTGGEIFVIDATKNSQAKKSYTKPHVNTIMVYMAA